MGQIRGYDAWMRALTDQDVPTLNSVVRDICVLSERDKCHADELTNIILRDASLTSKVLKVANSIHYNRTFIPIKTVSRGIVQLGFDNLKNIVLAASLIDSFLKGKYKTLVMQCMANSFHAAVQAKGLVPFLGQDKKEQVFIAALLQNIGELALLASQHDEVADFVIQRNHHPEQEAAIAQTFLGADIQQINKGIIKAWSLTPLLTPTAENNQHSNAMVSAIALGVELSKYFHKGIHSAQMQRLIRQVSGMNRISILAAHEQVKQMAEEAGLVARCYGVGQKNPEIVTDTIQKEAESAPSVETKGYEFHQRLNQIMRLNFEGAGIAKVLQASVDALHLGSGIPRVSIALCDHRSRQLEFEYADGPATRIWRQTIHIELDKLNKNELLSEFFQSQQPIWYQPAEQEKYLGALSALTERGDLMLSALKIEKRLFAVIYADGAGHSLSPRHFEDFQLVTNQLNLMLKVTANVQ